MRFVTAPPDVSVPRPRHVHSLAKSEHTRTIKRRQTVSRERTSSIVGARSKRNDLFVFFLFFTDKLCVHHTLLSILRLTSSFSRTRTPLSYLSFSLTLFLSLLLMFDNQANRCSVSRCARWKWHTGVDSSERSGYMCFTVYNSALDPGKAKSKTGWHKTKRVVSARAGRVAATVGAATAQRVVTSMKNIPLVTPFKKVIASG